MSIASPEQQKDMKISGAEQIVRSLEHEGVEYIFAYPGGTSMEVHQALLDSSVKVILPRHEQGGGFAADGYARRSGRPGVCLVTSGPGATNLVTAVTDAYMDSIPMVIFTCQVNQHLIGKNAFQETDIIGMTRPCVKHSYLVFRVEEISQVIRDAFFLAVHGRPGPVVVDIPCDVLQERCLPSFPDRPSLRNFAATPRAEECQIQAILAAIAGSSRPCIYAGGGIIHSGTGDLLRRFAEECRIPVATTLMGIGAIPENHPLSLKMLGMHGSYAANRAVHECDLLLGMCVRFSDRVTGDIQNFAPRARIIHVDIDPSEINKNKHADMAVVCSVRDLLERLLECRLERRTDPGPWLQQVDCWKKEHPLSTGREKAGLIQPQKLVGLLHRLTGGRAVIVTGVGQHQMWAAQFYDYRRPRQLLTSGGLGAMGFGLPAAVGAQLASPEDTVILLDGDGSFQMNIQELAMVFNEQVPVKMIIFNNERLGMVAQWEDRFKQGRHADTDLRVRGVQGAYPDFCTIARGYRIPGHEVFSPADLEMELLWLLKEPGPALLDVHINPEAQVLPMIPPGKTSREIILE